MKKTTILIALVTLLKVNCLFATTKIDPNNFTEQKFYVHFIFKDIKTEYSEVMNLILNYGLQAEGISVNPKIASKVFESITDYSNSLVYGGTPVAGTLTVNKNFVYFEPYAINSIFLKNLKSIKIPIKDIVSSTEISKTIFVPFARFELKTSNGSITIMNTCKSILATTLGVFSDSQSELISIIAQLKKYTRKPKSIGYEYLN